MSGRRILAGVVIAAAIVLLVGRWTATIYTDYLWYSALGAPDVWRARAMMSAVLTIVSFLVASAFAFLNLYAVRQSVVSLVLPRRIANIEIGEEVTNHRLMTAVVALSVIVGALLTFPTEHWHTALLARIGIPFGERDTYFETDLGFFVYWLPFESMVHVWTVIVLISVTGLVIVLYALTPSLRWDRGTLYVSAYVRRHFTVLGAVLLVLLAWSYRLAMYHALMEGSGPAGVFTSVDQKLLGPMLLLSVITLCAAAVVAWAGWTGQMRLAFGAVTVILGLSLLNRTISPLVFRRMADTDKRPLVEKKYIATRLTYTQRAYAVDRMRAESLGAVGFATPADAASRVAIWDGATLARASERLRRVHVMGEEIAWQATPSGIAALLVEHSNEGSSDGRDVWGVGRFDPSTADERGYPLRAPGTPVVGDELLLGEPAVYDSAPGYSVLSDSLRQLVGVEMMSTRSRLVHAWSLQNFRLLFGDLPASKPVMVQRRSVRERVEALAPFFVQGSAVVPLIANDSLYWVIELYSASSTYPLSQRFTILGEERSYFQHAATALIHAASGRVKLVIRSDPDPLARTWSTYLPSLFREQSWLAPAVRQALPPITDGARAQALAFATSGFRGDTLESRHFAVPDGADSAASREPMRAMIPTLGGVASVWPLLDSTERVRGVVAAAGGAVRSTSWIPLYGDVGRWGSVLDRLRAVDTTQHETASMRLPVRVVPVSGRPFYVQPTFQSRPGATPSLQHVAALLDDSVRTGPTLLAAIGASARPAVPSAEVVLRSDSLYRVMREALGQGDWASFGRAFDALGVSLHVRRP
ncbi:MAG: hypothetical protein JWM95_5284 [Gemmatimonadetes bacterium]|nr:hypothetical protein [Gemmatimonadota bacterium]